MLSYKQKYAVLWRGNAAVYQETFVVYMEIFVRFAS